MALQESGEMYLETIHRLSLTQQYVRSIDVAETLGYSKPTFSCFLLFSLQASAHIPPQCWGLSTAEAAAGLLLPYGMLD